MIRIPSSTKCLRLNIFQMEMCLKQSQPRGHLHGKASFAQKIKLKEMVIGEWGMVKVFR